MSEESFPEDRAWSFIFPPREFQAAAGTDDPPPEPAVPESPPLPVEPTITKAAEPAAAAEEPPPETGTDRKLRVNTVEAALGTSREVTIGSAEAVRRVRIKVPPRSKHGTVLRIRHEETVYKFSIEIVAHPWASVDGANLHLRVPITLAEAVEGAVIEIPTLSGQRSIRLPQAWTPAHCIIIKGGGLSGEDNAQGDMYVVPYIVPPDNESEAVQEAARTLSEHYRKPVRASMPKSLI